MCNTMNDFAWVASPVEEVSTRLAPGGGHIASGGGGSGSAGAQHVHLRLMIHGQAMVPDRKSQPYRSIINPRRAFAARVTVVVLSVCLSVCLFVCLFVCLRLFSHYGLRGGL